MSAPGPFHNQLKVITPSDEEENNSDLCRDSPSLTGCLKLSSIWIHGWATEDVLAWRILRLGGGWWFLSAHFLDKQKVDWRCLVMGIYDFGYPELWRVHVLFGFLKCIFCFFRWSLLKNWFVGGFLFFQFYNKISFRIAKKNVHFWSPQFWQPGLLVRLGNLWGNTQW